jgi:Zn-dependent protease with chaperone function
MEDRARAYHRWQLALAVVNLVVSASVLAGATWLLVRVVRPPAPATALALARAVAVELAGLGLALGLATAPIAVISGYGLARRFGLLHQSFGGWLGDRLKAGAVGAGLGLLAFEVLYAALAWTSFWWLVAAGLFFAGYALLAIVAPVWLLPLFYRLTPLDDAALRDRLLALAARAGVPAVAVWVADQSRKSKTANAALAGLGPTRRIILFDTLTAHFTGDEIESVLAHELGHHVHRDVRRGLLGQGALTLGTFWVADRLLRWSAAVWGFRGIGDPAGLPWLALILLGLGVVAGPAVNAFSRRLERQADDFAVATTGNVPAFVGALERLAALNLAERRPNRVKEALLYSHPSIDRRIARAAARLGARS